MRSLITGVLLLAFTAFSSPASAAAGQGSFNITTIIFFVLAGIVIWLGLSSMQRKQRVQAVETVVHGNYADYMLQVLTNAAKIDGRIDDAEREAIAAVMSEAKGTPYTREEVDAALARAILTQQQLVAYLGVRANDFSVEQKTRLLKGVLTVAMADGRFDQREHAIYLHYIAAVGFDRKTAPDLLQSLIKDLAANKFS